VVRVIVVRAITLLEHTTEKGEWVDKEQVDSFIEEYNRSPDKQKQYSTIRRVGPISSLVCPLIGF